MDAQVEMLEAEFARLVQDLRVGMAPLGKLITDEFVTSNTRFEKWSELVDGAICAFIESRGREALRRLN